jgi:hypothetical protein
VTINFESLPPVRLVTHDDILGLSVLSHLVEGDLVGIVHDNQIIKLFMGCESGSLSGDTLLEATISGKHKDVVSKDLVFGSVVNGLSHLLRGSNSSSVGNSLSEGTSSGLNSGGVVLRVRELRVTRGHGVILTEVGNLGHGKIKSSNIQPGVQEHGSMSSRKDESITVDPLRVGRVVGHLTSWRRSKKVRQHKIGRLCDTSFYL